MKSERYERIAPEKLCFVKEHRTAALYQAAVRYFYHRKIRNEFQDHVNYLAESGILSLHAELIIETRRRGNMENKQDLRVQKTYQALTDTFSEMMGEMPLEEIKINELCNRAQVRRQTFYTHFDGKEDFTQFYLSRVRGEAEAYVGTDIDVFIHSFQETIHNAIQFLQTHERMI
ncbi:MAG: hypothetical protein ACI4HH_07120, partial [Hominenteromicrobium mulieris]